jgi:hypothetical protein
MTYLMKNDKFALLAAPEYPLGQHLKLYRLVAMRDIGIDVKAGDQGGLVSGPMNLSEKGECWVYPDSMVHSGARVMDDAQVRVGASVSGPVRMRERSKVIGRITLMAHIELRHDQVLEAQYAVIVNLSLHRIGQFVKEGLTTFAMDLAVNDGALNSVALKADQCSELLAAFLCCRQVGDKVAFIKAGFGQHELLPVQADGSLAHDIVKMMLPS